MTTFQSSSHASQAIASLSPAIVAAALFIGSLAVTAFAQSAPYTIPLIDLAQEKHRQVIVDEEPGQYLGHPSTLLLEDNKTMLVVYPKGHGSGPIVYKRSLDGGKTWSERLPTPANWATSKETPTLFRVVSPCGKKRIILFSGRQTKFPTEPIRMAVSEDDGQTWTELEPIGNYGGVVAMSSVVGLKDGALMALFHDDDRLHYPEKKIIKQQATVLKTISLDGGLTWGPSEVVTRHPEAFLCEPGALRSPDGKQIAVLLRENTRKFNSFVIFSNDEGKTWTEPREVTAALTGDRHMARYSLDGRLVVVFRDMAKGSPTHGDFVAWVGTYEDIVKGREGQYRVRLLDNKKGSDTGYAGLELLPDGTFVATTYCHLYEGKPPLIASVRFTLKEVDEKAARR